MTPVACVQAFFARWSAGEIDHALALWAPGALWHITGESAVAGDYAPASYLKLVSTWGATYPLYKAEKGAFSMLGELAFFDIRSQGGEAPGEAKGMMIYRVVDGKIAEGWAIPASHGGRFTF